MSHARTRHALSLAAALGLAVAGAGALLAPASATPSGKVTLCHATHSSANPYVQVTVNTSSVVEANHVVANGHGTHTGPVFDPKGGQHQPAWGDIIPAFSGASSFAGLNLDEAGSAILANGCVVPEPVVTPTPSPTETSATPTPSETASTPSPTPTETSSTPVPTPTESSPAPVAPPTPTASSTPKPKATSTVSAPQTLPSTGGTALAHTGAPLGLMAALGAALLAAGGVTVLASRRRPVLGTATDEV